MSDVDKTVTIEVDNDVDLTDEVQECKDPNGAGPNGSRSVYQRHPKPPFSYIALIAMAIRDSPKGKLTLAQINEYLMRKFSFFRGEYQGWKNSIRHNLSLNECFIKILRDPNRPWGKDNYWTLNPSSEYTFADGVFRRRRKKLNGSSCKSGNSPPLITTPSIEVESRKMTKNEKFSIDYLLKSEKSDVLYERTTEASPPNRQLDTDNVGYPNQQWQHHPNFFAVNFEQYAANQQLAAAARNGLLFGYLPLLTTSMAGNTGDLMYGFKAPHS